jgi:hypothetical protein
MVVDRWNVKKLMELFVTNENASSWRGKCGRIYLHARFTDSGEAECSISGQPRRWNCILLSHYVGFKDEFIIEKGIFRPFMMGIIRPGGEKIGQLPFRASGKE